MSEGIYPISRVDRTVPLVELRRLGPLEREEESERRERERERRRKAAGRPAAAPNPDRPGIDVRV